DGPRGTGRTASVMENQALEPHGCEDVRKSGYLRKQKSMHRRYFVLRSASERGPARLEYYESEKKFRSKTCFNINKRADSKNKHMIVLYTRAESFAVAAESEADQDEWYQSMVDLQCKTSPGMPAGTVYRRSPIHSSPSPLFVPHLSQQVWQVKVWPKGLGQAKNLVGIYRLCLTDKTVNFVKLNSDAAAVVLQLMNVRRCGHSENFFFVEVGRSAVTGPGEFWMQVDDSVVAQNMHETLLEAMKALSEEFRQRSKSQSSSGPGGGATASNPISVPSRRHHPNPPPSQVGFNRPERRLLSKRASLPPMALERLAPRQRRAEEPTDEESADYAIMSRSTSRESFTPTPSSTQRQSVAAGSGYLDVASELKSEGGGGGGSVDVAVDNGYMSMLPGVTQPQALISQSMAVSVPESDSKPADDYMAMTPNNSVSPHSKSDLRTLMAI
uniref:Si:ch73-335l21.1 n=1 Tax=Neogobius melanostomus TaxID=47308 RepID=A0A8C6TE39_9GOBI